MKWLLATNLFILGCGVLQTFGSLWYFKQGMIKFGVLYFLYALTNYVLWWCKGE